MSVCDICNVKFKSEKILEQHLKRKNKCNLVTPYQCLNCNKYFKYKKNLKEHQLKQVCKIYDDKNTQLILNNLDNEYIDSELLKLFELKISDESKMDIIANKYNSKLSKNTILEIIKNNKLNITEKINLINTTDKNSNISVSNINNGSIVTETNSHNNITNNIQINTFGKEDISYLDNEYFKNLIMNQHIEKGYVQLIKDIYLNKDHPENSTVKVENINNKYAHVYNNGKWDAILKADLKEELHKKNYTILKMHYDKLKKSMSIPKREETYTFLKRDDFSDPHMMYVIDKIILLFYNDTDDDEDILEKSKINKSV
jgi:hypothetical protein